jgi:hypothetical protein
MNKGKVRSKLVFLVVLVLAIVVIATIIILNNRPKEVSDVTIENNKATNDVSIQEIEIKDITKVYESGITTIRAKMYNKTTEVKNVTVKIILKDAQGNELKNMIQVVENLKPDREKVLSTGIAGDYSNVSEIKFEIVK